MVEIILPIIKASYIATIIKTMWYWQRDRQINQRNRIQSPEIVPHKYVQMNFDKVTKPIQ